eukprot:CAMPEP_0178972112 /NCGR_PEP_ID=MMETSP0789-20121207/20783_1 /TAXON_ID=3005 /ORGANISM="Rhizosolenia setigera, Strain CCMP 1694" /LENGTH=265 /DNA_ID=CAMNT_0020659425 /DNA_START=251 /DNA_END=1045 /DNA_ORIENTATION=+
MSKTTFRKTTTKTTALSMNFFSDLGDLVTGGAGRALIPQDRNALPYNTPLCSTHSFSDNSDLDEQVEQKFAIRERALSFTGEDFDIYCPERNSPIVKVRGAMLHLPGKDKMRIESNCDGTFKEVAVLDRVLMAVTPTYDIYRGGMGAEKIGWIEKKVVSLTESFDIYMEGKGGFGPFKPPPAYEITGNFLERNFVMKNQQGEVVARFSQDGIFQFDSFNHYQVIVADGMDALLVLACACAIDEEMDEEHQEKKKKEADEGQGGGG